MNREGYGTVDHGPPRTPRRRGLDAMKKRKSNKNARPQIFQALHVVGRIVWSRQYVCHLGKDHASNITITAPYSGVWRPNALGVVFASVLTYTH